MLSWLLQRGPGFDSQIHELKGGCNGFKNFMRREEGQVLKRVCLMYTEGRDEGKTEEKMGGMRRGGYKGKGLCQGDVQNRSSGGGDRGTETPCHKGQAEEEEDLSDNQSH